MMIPILSVVFLTPLSASTAEMGCLSGICVGKPVSTLPKEIRFDSPKATTDLYAELAKAEKEKTDSYVLKNLKTRIQSAETAVKKAYVIEERWVKELAKHGNLIDSGNLKGHAVDASILTTLAQAKASCQPMSWRLEYTTKSGYLTKVIVAWATKNEAGDQELRIEKIVRDYSSVKSKEERAELKAMLEKELGMKIEGIGGPAETRPIASLGSDLVLLAPRPLDYTKYKKALAKHPLCQGRVSIE